MARKNRKYFLTSYGKVVYEAHMLIGMALQNYWKLKAIDSMLSDTNYEISGEERKRVIDTLIESDTIKEILGYKNLAPAKKEKIRDNQELIVSTISY